MFQRDSGEKGHLVLIGGNEDRVGGRTVLKRIVSLNAVRQIAVIPTASEFPRELGEKYERAFRELGVPRVTALDIRYPGDADAPGRREQVRGADAIFFTGGDLVKLVQILKGSALFGEIRRRFEAGATVAGTSAGAAAASDPMIYNGDENGFQKGAVRHAEGFGFLPGITVDTHFLDRRRLPRLAQALCAGLSQFGLGLDEDTGVVVYPNRVAEVVGAGVVTTLDARPLRFTDYHSVQERERFACEGLRLGFLTPGTFFNLNRWRVCSGRSCRRLPKVRSTT